MAKVNLGLDVLRRREDGYHEVKMIMQTVDLFDRLTLKQQKEDEIRIRTNQEELPTDEGNLIYRAAKLMKETFQIREGIEVELEKNIPIAAGMAGGSTDAAAVIVGMNRLFGLGLTMEEMQAVGVKIGADVPYCIQGGTALAEGIGEKLTRLPDAPDCWLVIAKPEINVSTKYVYEHLHANQLEWHPDIDGMAEGIREGNLEAVAQRMGNVLETVTAGKYPVIEDMKHFLCKEGALNALMSGSGPTVFAVFEDETEARNAFDKMKAAGFTRQVYLTRPARETCVLEAESVEEEQPEEGA